MKKSEWHNLLYEGVSSKPDRTSAAEAHFDAASDWFSGHFPNEPILPGIALLSAVSEVIQQYEAARGRTVSISGIRRVRFRVPVRPGASVTITVSPAQDFDSYAFRAVVHGETVCSGTMDVQGRPHNPSGVTARLG